MTTTTKTPFRFGQDSDGNYGYIITDSEGADSVIPFKTASSVMLDMTCASVLSVTYGIWASNTTRTYTVTASGIYAAFAYVVYKDGTNTGYLTLTNRSSVTSLLYNSQLSNGNNCAGKMICVVAYCVSGNTMSIYSASSQGGCQGGTWIVKIA